MKLGVDVCVGDSSRAVGPHIGRAWVRVFWPGARVGLGLVEKQVGFLPTWPEHGSAPDMVRYSVVC